jgi:predicted Zn-dependent protease
MIRAVEFENELAANMAFQFGQILKGHVLLRMQDDRVREQGGDREGTPALLEGIVSSAPKAERDIDYFSPTGIFELSDELNLNAVNPAVEILYQAGYDPRGLVAVWEKLLAHPDRSPYEAVLLRKLIEKTRRTIAQYSPLRNPIVRSQDFISIQRRIQKL